MRQQVLRNIFFGYAKFIAENREKLDLILLRNDKKINDTKYQYSDI